MKRNNTYVLFDSGNIEQRADWATAHSAISRALTSMRWPNVEGVTNFRIPRIVTIKAGEEYVDPKDKTRKAPNDDKTLRNGVRPLRDQFHEWMIAQKWTPEQPLSLKPYFQRLRVSKVTLFSKYPPPAREELEKAEADALNESVGDFDFWFQTESKFRTIVEWETGNISSSHRSLNKMCLALQGELADAGVLIVPSKILYPHLTNRIGNIRELQPYFYFWNQVGTLIESGLLAVVEIEHDELVNSTDMRDFVPIGPGGNSKTKKKKGKKAKKAAQ